MVQFLFRCCTTSLPVHSVASHNHSHQVSSNCSKFVYKRPVSDSEHITRIFDNCFLFKVRRKKPISFVSFAIYSKLKVCRVWRGVSMRPSGAILSLTVTNHERGACARWVIWIESFSLAALAFDTCLDIRSWFIRPELSGNTDSSALLKWTWKVVRLFSEKPKAS